MLKILKKLSLIAVAVCLTFTSVFAAACNNDNNPKKVGYIITVLYPDGSPVKGTIEENQRDKVAVQLLDADGNKLLEQYKSLDNNGVAYTDYTVPGEYKIKFINLPAGYGYDENITTDKKKANLTIQLSLLPTDYQISVTMPDGSAAANVKAKMMSGETVINEVTTDNQGKATFPTVDAGKYPVILEGIPAHYGYMPITTAMNGEPIEVELFYINDITLDDAHKMTDRELELWGNTLNSDILNRVNTSVANYIYTVEIGAREEVFYAIKAEKDGAYTINAHSEWETDEEGNLVTVTNPYSGLETYKTVKNAKDEDFAKYDFKFYGLDFSTEYPDLAITGSVNNGNNTRPISLKAGQTFYFSVSSLDRKAYTMTFAISYDVEPQHVETSETGEFELTFNEIDYAVIEFQPTRSGKYTITSSTDKYDPRLERYRDLSHPYTEEDGSISGNDDGPDGRNFIYIEDISESFVGNTYIYRIYLKNYDITENATIKVTITRTGDATPEKEITRKTAEVTATLTKEPDVDADKDDNEKRAFIWLPTDGSAKITEEGEAYYYTDGNGAKHKVYIAITKPFDNMEYSFSTIEYMGEGNLGSGDAGQPVKQNEYLTVYDDLEKLDTTYNYTDFVTEYSNYVNNYGVYSLNSELKLFAERYMNQRGRLITEAQTPVQEVADGCWWMIACGYYEY